MSHVDFKKWPCRPVEFKGQGPHEWEEQVGAGRGDSLHTYTQNESHRFSCQASTGGFNAGYGFHAGPMPIFVMLFTFVIDSE